MAPNKEDARGQYAGLISRGVALLLDIVIANALVIGFIWLFDHTAELMGIPLTDCSLRPGLFLGVMPFICNAANIGRTVVSALLLPAYFVFFWALAGQTLADGLLGVRVVRLDGSRMNLTTALVRLVGYVVCILSFGIGFLWALIDDRRQGWHDKLARTCVVYSWRARQNPAGLAELTRVLSGPRPVEAHAVQSGKKE